MFIALEQTWHDIRYGLRSLAAKPAFAFVAAGSLALGIGAATAMYSVIHAVILDPFPYKDVDRLASIEVRDLAGRGRRTYYRVEEYLEFARRSTLFEGVIASTISDVVWTGSGEPRRLRGNHVSMNTFDVMGVPPLLGRVITPADTRPDAEPIVILGYRSWQRDFGGDPAVIGQRLRLNNKVREVAGIMPPRFMGRGADVYLPVIYRTGEVTEGVRDVHVLGRVKPGVTPAQAEADLRPIVEDLRKRFPTDFPEKFSTGLLPFKETFPSGITRELWILFGAVGLLLLIACVNVSNLLLSKASTRAREIAVRASLGATRIRVIRQLLAESLVLALAGGIAGAGLAWAGLKGIIAMVPPNTIPDEAKVAMNLPVLAFTIAVCAASALLFGLAPALHLAGQDPIVPLRQSGRSNSGTLRQRILRSALVVAEVALSVMLLVGASLMARTLVKITSLDMPVRPAETLTLRVPLAEERYPDAARRTAFYRDLLQRVRTLPGVTAAAVTSTIHPLGDWSTPVETPGSARSDSRRVQLHRVSSGYQRLASIPLLSGRFLDETDEAAARNVVVVNQAFVDRYYPGEQALGRLVKVPRLRQPPANLKNDAFEIVGVVKNTANDIESDQVMPEMFMPYTLIGISNWLAVSSPQAGSLGKSVRAQVHALDAEQPVMDERTLEQLLSEWVYSRPKFNLLLFAAFAGLGLLLALLGIYGVISHGVEQRTQEFGIRLALGATLGDIMSSVLGRGAVLVGAGVALGLAGSLASVRVLANQVFRLSTFDPISFIGVAVVLLAAGLAACWRPARRASKVDPAIALRYE